jgi:hypothetical protein
MPFRSNRGIAVLHSFMKFPTLSRVTLVLAALTLPACASSDVSGINVARQDQIGAVNVLEVNVEMQVRKPSPVLQAALKDELEKAMPYCATGPIDHRLNVTITNFEDQDVGRAIFIGDEIKVEGRVELVDMATDMQIGEYYVENSFAWGGLIGAAMMSDAERSLSKDFAEVICEELFGVDLQGRKRQSKEEGPRGSTGIGLGKSCSDSRPLYGLTACN